MTFEVTYIQAFAWSISIIGAAYLTGLRNGDRTRLPRVTLRGNWLKLRFGMFWRM
jgi:hypothetical protein